MMQPTHCLSGAAAGAWLALRLQPSITTALAGVCVGAVTAALPDTDHLDASPVRMFTIKRVRIRKKQLLGWTWFKGWTWRIGPGPLVSWVIRLVSKLLTGTKHRGATHSISFAILIGCLTALAANQAVSSLSAAYLGLSAFCGVVAALLGDLVTHSGLRHLLWPLRVQVSIPRLLRVKAGGKFEKLVVLPSVGIAAGVGLLEILAGGVHV